MARTLAITGGTGFVGGHTLERALGRGWVQRMSEAQQIDMACKGRAAGDPWVEIERWLLRSTLPAARAARFAA